MTVKHQENLLQNLWKLNCWKWHPLDEKIYFFQLPCVRDQGAAH